MCKSHTKKIGALKLSQQDVGKNCIFRGCAAMRIATFLGKEDGAVARVVIDSARIVLCFFFSCFRKRKTFSFFFFLEKTKRKNKKKKNKKDKT